MAKEKKVPIEDRAAQRIMWKVDAEFKATGDVSKDTAVLATVIVLGSVMRRLDRVIERLDNAGRRPKETGGWAIAKNPGAPLLARLQAADELAEASAQILRACASSVPHVFSNAQFALGEKLEAYKTAKETE